MIGHQHTVQMVNFVLEDTRQPVVGFDTNLFSKTILGFYRSLKEPGFELTKLTLRKRVYVFGEGADSKPFVRDVCNPAIHNWEVRSLAA